MIKNNREEYLTRSLISNPHQNIKTAPIGPEPQLRQREWVPMGNGYLRRVRVEDGETYETCSCGDLYPAHDLESAQRHLHEDVGDLVLKEVRNDDG